jgi:cytidylate kinase
MSAKIGTVGPCAAGKSTLAKGLNEHGYRVRHIAQEHSYVPEMWQKISNPDILIYLDVSFQVSTARKNLNLTEAEFKTQLDRLAHARQHADLYIQTDTLTVSQVLTQVLQYLSRVEH